MINSQEEHEANMNAQGEAEAMSQGEREALWQENERLVQINTNLTAEVTRLGNLLSVRDKHMEVLRKVIEIQEEDINRFKGLFKAGHMLKTEETWQAILRRMRNAGMFDDKFNSESLEFIYAFQVGFRAATELRSSEPD